ncbi:MAG: succinate-semialdehyde dehydrogenase / glutarate-semialdehyde dehydrogenase, partial [Methanolobus sp.]|nr:succinate-semialdehyde dehydrogenase / glutarate-semialdehyde dehydrogenase [Methanolobus sp.]
VAGAAGKSIKKFILELGGSDPLIVLEDADVDKVAKAAVIARFQNCGQSCIAAKRLLVDEKIAADFTEKFTEHVRDLKIGDPMDNATDMGPMAGEKQRNILEEQILLSKNNGAKAILEGGKTDDEGYFYKPSVLSNVSEKAPVVVEETFGPVAPIITFNNEEDAIKIANNTEFGLGASIWSKDKQKAMRMTKHIEAGVITINNIVSSDPRLPFGGMKKSGIGREMYRHGMLEFMNVKSMKVY